MPRDVETRSEQSDTDIADEILECLVRAPEIDAREIAIDIVEGSVILLGRVATSEEASAAASLVGSTVEVEVVNELTVDPGLREDRPSQG